jgi:trehalose 6-phosphate synthase/phosphatase
LQADLVGFHLFEYARNFLNCCERLFNLNLDYSNGGFLSVNYHGRIVGVRVSHIGIDEEFIQLIMNSKDFKKQVTAFKDEFKIITEAARRSTLQSQGSRSSANLGL